MTINWFSPLPPAPSPLARVTRQLLPALAQRAKVVLWTAEKNWSPLLENFAEIQLYDPAVNAWAKINAAEVSIYHLAHNTAEHAPIWTIARAHPGIVVLHEANLQPLLTSLLQCGRIESAEYLRMVEFHLGTEGLAAVANFLSGNCTLDRLGAAGSMLGVAAENALGLVATSRETEAALTAITSLPIAFLPSPATDPPASAIEEYVGALLQFIRVTEKTRLEFAARWLSSRVGQLLQPWYGERNARLLLPNTTRALAELFGGEVR
ncbi:MAG: hypothetical protein M3Y03_06415 [Verrucomicrobiota bacterium]|nr:hypothetical protein [Verrucomicrobiota bacterium]